MSHKKSRLCLMTESSNCVACGRNLPKLTFEIAPHSPFNAKFDRSQSGVKSLLRSVQLRNAVKTDEANGWKRRVMPLRLSWLERPAEALRAVRPLPWTSRDTPT